MQARSPKELAVYVTDQRKKQKLTQARVGDLVGLKQATISAFENNPETTRIDTLFRILSAINLDLKLEPRSKDEISETEW